MKMTEVITDMREALPGLVAELDELREMILKATQLAHDTAECRTAEGRKVLSSATYTAVLEAQSMMLAASASATKANEALAKYTREFKTADDPRQLELQLDLPTTEGGTETSPSKDVELNEPSQGDMEEVANARVA